MADFEFQIKREGTVYDWPQVIGQAPGLYDEEEGAAASERFKELPFEKKKQLYDAWVPEMRSSLKAVGAEDLTPFENYVENERGFLEEMDAFENPPPDTLGQDLSAAAGKTIQGIGDRLSFWGTDTATSALTDPLQMQRRLAQRLPNQPQEQGVSFADMLQGDLQQAAGGLEIMGQTIQDASGAREESKTFQPGNHKWWLEKGVPTLGGLLVDLGLASVSGGAAPFAFAASAGSQMGGSVLNESRAAYQEDAKKKYDARLQAGETVAEARAQLRGELQQADKKAEAEAVLIGSVSAVLNTVPGMTMTRPLGAKIKEIAIRKGIPAFVARFGMSAVAEGVTEILDELAQDGGRIGRDIGDLKSRMEAWKQSEPGQRYLAAGTLGAVMGAGVDVVSNLTKSKKADLRERVNEAAPVEPPGPTLASDPSTAPETPTETPESATEAPVAESSPMAIPESALKDYLLEAGALEEELSDLSYEDLKDLADFQGMDPTLTPEENLADLRARKETARAKRQPPVVEDGTPIRYKKDIAKGTIISWLTPLGTVESGVVKNRDKDTIAFEDGRTKSFQPGRLFSGLVTPKENTANMAIGDVLSTGDALYQYVGDGLFNVGSRFNGKIEFDRYSRDPLGKDIINDPRTALYSREAFDGAAKSYNSRPDPKKTDTFGPYLEQIGEKPHDQARTASPEASGQAQPATGEGSSVPQVPGQEAGPQEVQAAVAAEASSTPPTEEASLSQLRAELTRRAKLDKGKDNRVQEAQIENLVQVIDASATALASRTGRSKADILARISFSHDKPAGTKTPNDMAGEYDAINRIIRLYPKTNATTVVHEWMHFVLEEHVYNLDEDMNILNREERKILEAYTRSKIPTGKLKGGLLRSGAKPSKVYHEFMADLMEHMFQSRYQSGNKPSGMPDQILNLLKKVGDFIRQVYSKIRYNWTSTEFDGSANEETVLNLMDRIFVPEQIETMVNRAGVPPDVVLPQPDLNDAPDVNRMFEDMKAMSHSQTKTPITPSSYQKIDRLEAEGRLGQTVPQEEQQAPGGAPVRKNGYRQPMLASREFERSVRDGITDFVALMENSRYPIKNVEATMRAARDFLGGKSTGDAIGIIMGDPNTSFAKIQGEMPADVYVASAMILANRLRTALSYEIQQQVALGEVSTNDAYEISAVYETYLKYFVETISPGAGRSVNILKGYSAPTSSKNRAQRFFGILDATSTALVEKAKERLGEDRMAWIRSYALRDTEGAVTKENYKRRKREFLEQFEKAYPPEQRAYVRSAMSKMIESPLFRTQEQNDAFRLAQTILENPNGNIPDTAIRAFGRNYNFQAPVWRNVEALFTHMDTYPADSAVRDKIQGQVVALLASDAGIPMGALVSAHYMAQYLCAPTTPSMSVVGNGLTMTCKISRFLLGTEREPVGARLRNADRTPYIVRGDRINPNIRYVPLMLESLWRNHSFPSRDNPNNGAVWKNILSSLQGFGPSNRLNTAHFSASETFDSAIRYNHPSGRLENLGDITKQAYSLFLNSPGRIMGVADALVGTGTRGLTSTVAAAQVAEWNAINYRRRLEADPSLVPSYANIDDAVRNYRNFEYTRLSGNDPAVMARSLQAAVAQIDALSAIPELGRSKLTDNFNRNTLIWMAYRQIMEQAQEQAMAAEENVPPIDEGRIAQDVQQEALARGVTLTPVDEARLVAAGVAAEEEQFQQANMTNYQQEVQLDEQLSSFTYRPKGNTGRLVNVVEQAIGTIALNAGRIGQRHVVTAAGGLAEEGGLNMGGFTSQVVFPFIRSIALGSVLTLQFSPFGWIAVIRRGPIGGRGTWNDAEQRAFTSMSILGSIGLLGYIAMAWNDDDPLEEGKKHIIGAIPSNEWGRRLKARGIEPYSEYHINKDGSVWKRKLNTIQGPTTSPLLWIGAFNSTRWNNMAQGKDKDWAETSFEASGNLVKTLGMSGPLGSFAKYGAEMSDRKFVDVEQMGQSSAMQMLKGLGMDGILPYRRAFNEAGALINNAGIAAGMNWEPDTKALPATVNGQPAINLLKNLTSDYLVFSGISSRPVLNGFGEPLAEDANLLRKVATVTPRTPMNDLLSEHGLTLSPMSQYRSNIRKGGSDKEMRELFAQVGKRRSDTLPSHLVGNLKNEEVYEYLSEFYNPLLMKTVGETLKGDPYSKPVIKDLLEKAMENPASNSQDTPTIQRAILQAYVDKLRSEVEKVSMAQYFAAKNPDLDSDFVADYVTDLVEASGEGQDFR